MTRKAVEECRQSAAPKPTLVSINVWVDLSNGDEYERYVKNMATVDPMVKFPIFH